MSHCPYDDNGYHCNIVSHPDAPNDSFCATCDRRVRFRGEDTASFWTIVQILLGLAIVLTIVTKPLYRPPQPSQSSSSLLSPPCPDSACPLPTNSAAPEWVGNSSSQH